MLPTNELVLLHQHVVVPLQQLDHLVPLYRLDLLLVGRQNSTAILDLGAIGRELRS